MIFEEFQKERDNFKVKVYAPRFVDVTVIPDAQTKAFPTPWKRCRVFASSSSSSSETEKASTRLKRCP